MRAKDRERFQARFAKRQQRRKVPKIYHQRILRPDGSLGWAGGRDLASSADFTGQFCRALMRCWETDVKGLVPDPHADAAIGAAENVPECEAGGECNVQIQVPENHAPENLEMPQVETPECFNQLAGKILHF